MRTAPLIRAGWVTVCLLALATVSLAQSVPSASPTPLRIGYAGKLLGYFRVPSEQARDSSSGCPVRAGANSEASDKFLAERGKYRDAVLVGTGDNFSPQLESRVFKAEGASPTPTEYVPVNKELYTWDNWDKKNKRWVPIGEESDELKALLARGEGAIPTDNVGCFLSAAGFSAVVPGKHDFYFGAERIRQLARFMAGIDQKDYSPVQMLGANLVIKTARLDGNQAPTTTEDWPKNLSSQNLKSVYPWFSAPISLKLTAPKGEKFQEKLKDWHERSLDLIKVLEDLLAAKAADRPIDANEREQWSKFLESLKAVRSVYICPTGDFNGVSTEECRLHGYQLKPGEVVVSKTDYSMTYSFSVEKANRAASGGKAGHYATFAPGQNYGLCLRGQPQPGGGEGGKGGVEKQCMVFSVLSPFLSHPRLVPSSADASASPDPDPFVFLPNTSAAHEVAIFGIVDPNIAEQVGVLNFSWRNVDEKLKSVVGVEDPVEALKQQLDYFKQWHEEQYVTRGHKPFSGVKILLAQMSPQRAKLLATHLRKFQVVVAGADQEQATDEIEQSIVWTPQQRAGAFIAVPSPSYDTKKEAVVVSMGLINAANDRDEWRLSAARSTAPARAVIEIENKREQAEENKANKQAPEDKLSGYLRKQLASCVSNAPDEYPPFGEQLKLLTLCAMRQRMGADVALLQQRDFFFNRVPVVANEIREFQTILDHVVWKGDLLTLLYVPGSAIKKALDQSKKYEQDDANPLSLTNEKSRGLVVLGVEKRGNDYIVNELPLDEKKIYAVATTDYIGAGDTGYPDLDAVALNHKKLPAQFPTRLETISSVVCRKLLSDKGEDEANCLRKLERDNYLDRLAAQAAPPKRPTGWGKRLSNLSPLKWPDEAKDPETLGEAAELNAQQHPFWNFSLQNLSFGFSRLSNNLTDEEVAEKFAGVSSSGISTSKFLKTTTVALGTRLSRLSHRNEFFVAAGLDFKEQTTGDEKQALEEKDPVILQLNNRVTAEVGLIHNIRGGRSRDRVGINFSLRAEAPFQRPFTTFTLGTGEPLKVIQGRSLLLLPRVGLRWQSGANLLEVGGQWGTELRALSRYQFETQGAVVECPPNVAESFATCVKRLSPTPDASIRKDSARRAIMANRRRAGAYLKFNLTVPFSEKVKYELKQEADFFFFNFPGDNATDTRYRDMWNNSLKFSVWPNLSFGPTLQLLSYRNKVNKDLLFQKNFGLEATFSFDIFNRREKRVQLKHKPAAASQ